MTSPMLKRADWEFLKRLFEGLSIGVILFRADLTIESINLAAAEMLGHDEPTRMVDRALFDLVPEMRERKPIYDRVLAGESIDIPNAEIPVVGRVRNYDVHYRPMGDDEGRATGFVVIAYETTDREQARRELARTEERYRTLYDVTPDMLLAVELPGRKIVECNSTLCAKLGYTRDEILGRSLLDYYHPSCLERVEASLELLKRDGQVDRAELQVMRKDGSTMDVELSSVAFRDRDGAIVGTRAVWHDITERKLNEERLRRSESQLRSLSNRTLRMQEDERKRLSREFHDEVGQIFTGLRMELAWVRSRLEAGQTDVKSRLETLDKLIAESIDRVRRIARSLRPEVLDTLGLVPAIEWQVQDFTQRSGIESELSVARLERSVGAEISTTVYRIVQEALTNITRHSEASRVFVELRDDADGLLLEIRDNGCGVDSDRISDSGSLGLRGMQERAKLVGGTVFISRTEPSGTSLLVRIPMPDTEAGGIAVESDSQTG